MLNQLQHGTWVNIKKTQRTESIRDAKPITFYFLSNLTPGNSKRGWQLLGTTLVKPTHWRDFACSNICKQNMISQLAATSLSADVSVINSFIHSQISPGSHPALFSVSGFMRQFSVFVGTLALANISLKKEGCESDLIHQTKTACHVV